MTLSEQVAIVRRAHEAGAFYDLFKPYAHAPGFSREEGDALRAAAERVEALLGEFPWDRIFPAADLLWAALLSAEEATTSFRHRVSRALGLGA